LHAMQLAALSQQRRRARRMRMLSAAVSKFQRLNERSRLAVESASVRVQLTVLLPSCCADNQFVRSHALEVRTQQMRTLLLADVCGCGGFAAVHTGVAPAAPEPR
jgi:hypothetical protein